jgi:septal ring factor EnvC (AmiA/AmiB activator)
VTRHRLLFGFACSLAFLILVAPAVAQRSVEDQRAELYRTRQRLDDLERRLTELRGRKYQTERKLEKDEEDLLLLRRLAAQIDEAQREKDATVGRLRNAMDNVGNQIEERKQALAQRLVNMYKYGRLFELELLLKGARTLPEVYRKMFYARMLAEADKHRLDELKQLQADLKVQQEHFRYAAAALRAIQDEYEQKRRDLESDKAFRTASLRNLKQEESVKEAAAERLAQAAAEIERLLESLEREQPASALTSTLTTRLPWPVTGRRKLGFGEDRSNGMVIAATAGAAVTAVAAGRVSYAEEFMTYGNLVIVDHGAGSFSLYGDLQDIAVGVNEDVAAGALLGHARSDLYFELRRQNSPVDPEPYLK